MTEKTRTVIVIESHEQTIIRRSRRTASSDEVRILAEPAELVPPDETTIQRKRALLGACLKTVALMSATLLRRLKTRTSTTKRRKKK